MPPRIVLTLHDELLSAFAVVAGCLPFPANCGRSGTSLSELEYLVLTVEIVESQLLINCLVSVSFFIFLLQNRSDAQKALSKNGMQINGVLIVGVKPLDPMQRQALNERLNNQGFMTLPPPASSRSLESNPSRVSPRPYYLQNGGNARQSSGAIASPAKSVVSKIMDLMFGV